MALIELTRVDLTDEGVAPPGRRRPDGTTEYATLERFLVNVPSTNRLRDRGHYRLSADLATRLVYVENVAEKTIAVIPFERVRQWEEAPAKKTVAVK